MHIMDLGNTGGERRALDFRLLKRVSGIEVKGTELALMYLSGCF